MGSICYTHGCSNAEQRSETFNFRVTCYLVEAFHFYTLSFWRVHTFLVFEENIRSAGEGSGRVIVVWTCSFYINILIIILVASLPNSMVKEKHNENKSDYEEHEHLCNESRMTPVHSHTYRNSSQSRLIIFSFPGLIASVYVASAKNLPMSCWCEVFFLPFSLFCTSRDCLPCGSSRGYWKSKTGTHPVSHREIRAKVGAHMLRSLSRNQCIRGVTFV